MNITEKTLLIYRDRILPLSETFIKKQAEHLKLFKPHFVGSKKAIGLVIPASSQTLINNGGTIGRMMEAGFKLTGMHFNVASKLSGLNPSLIHAHFGPDGILALHIAKKLKIPLIVTFHGYDATVKDQHAKKSFYLHRKYLKSRKRLQEQASLFIAVSDFVKQKLIDQGYSKHKIIRHYIGVDTDFFKLNPNMKRKNQVLFVGRLIENKGCEYLIKAMSVVQAGIPDAELVIIGDGPLKAQLERLACEQLKNYKFLGSMDQTSVKLFMNVAKVFCVPSVTIDSGASEAFGIVFLEASAMGLPVVSFSTGGIPEAIANNKTGFLVEERDWYGMSIKIKELLLDDILWNEFSREGQRRVKESFDLKEQTNELERIYSRLLTEEINHE
jgi:colanic acid/amylovoran biosynthesis glycosyltransferase